MDTNSELLETNRQKVYKKTKKQQPRETNTTQEEIITDTQTPRILKPPSLNENKPKSIQLNMF